MTAEPDACPVAAHGAELVDDDQLPYLVLFASVLDAGPTAVADRAAEYRAIFAAIAPTERAARGRAFRALCARRGL